MVLREPPGEAGTAIPKPLMKRCHVITARDLGQLKDGLCWLVRPDVYCAGKYYREVPMISISDPMGWEKEDSLTRRSIMNRVLMMEEIEPERPGGITSSTKDSFDISRREDINSMKQMLQKDAFDKLLPSEYKKLRNYLELLGTSAGQNLMTVRRRSIGRNVALLYHILGVDLNDPWEWGRKLQAGV